MDTKTLRSLADVFSQIPDPRCKRGVRHPFSGMLALVFLGLLARIRELARLHDWATRHWAELQEPLGFDSLQPPHATTLSRVLARFTLADFQQAFGRWLVTVVQDPHELSVAAVDAKTACQSHEDGRPVQILSVFAHRAKLVLAQWAVQAEKTNEPHVLLNHWDELLREFPMLRLLTGDAIYTQRHLADILSRGPCDYLLQVKKNQGDLHEALVTSFAQAATRPADAETTEKKGDAAKLVACGATWKTARTIEINSPSQGAASRCVWTVWSQPGTGNLLVMT
ncbi:MAG TPA: ISAs1 family transposase [Pirellulales bacterium]|jgi:hypothetical protein